MSNTASPLTAQDTLGAQMAFLSEIDRLKRVERQSLITGCSRREYSAEHSWHLAMFALILGRDADEVDPWRVVQMLLEWALSCQASGSARRQLRPNGFDPEAVTRYARETSRERIFIRVPVSG